MNVMSSVNHALPCLADLLTDVSIREGSQQTVDLRAASLDVKLDLMMRIVRAGVRRIELTAFAPGAWFADSHELASGAASLVPPAIILRALYFNTQGLDDLLVHSRLLREGIFHTAATSNYRRKNYRQRSIAHALEKMNRLMDAFQRHRLQFDTLVLSTAWGESGEPRPPSQVIAYLERLLESAAKRGLPVHSVTLADTVGHAAPADIAFLFSAVKAAWPDIKIRAHLHPRPGSAEECIDAALDSGVDGWEAAWGGLGGSPFAAGAGGNLDIRSLMKVYEKRGLDHGLHPGAVKSILDLIEKHTRRRVPNP